MKLFTKISLIICGVCLVLGVLMVGIGSMLGAKPEHYLNMAHIGPDTLEVLDDLDDLDDWVNAPKYRENPEIPEAKENPEAAEKTETAEDPDGDTASGEKEISAPGKGQYEYDQTFSEDIRELDVSVNYGEIHFYVHGEDEIRVIANHVGNTFQCRVDGNELSIVDKRKNNLGELGLAIFLPERELTELEVDLGAGVLEAQVLRAKEFNLDVGAGEGVIEELISNHGDLDVGAGRLQVDLFRGSSLDGDCGAGELVICLEGTLKDYNYELDAAMGEIRLGDSSYAGLGAEKTIRNNASRNIELDCAVGSVSVSFEK